MNKINLLPALSLFIFLGFSTTAFAESNISLPLRFHIVTGLSMEKDGLLMRSWVTKKNIENTVLPEINRIWRSANISFKVENIVVSEALKPAGQEELINGIVNAKRNSEGKSDPERIKKLNRLIDWDKHSEHAVNIYLVPYLGEKSQGNAKFKHKRIFVGQWSDKASKARKKPEKFQLTESEPFKKGSLSRTVAHELGHILGLKHPDKTKQTGFDLLMGGKTAGYRLRKEEIDTARQRAANLVNDFE